MTLRTELDKLLWESFGHIATVQALASASIALLLSCTLYFLSPVLEDDYHIYVHYLPWVYYLDWSHYDSFIVDHMVVFILIVLPIGWLFLVNAAKSSLRTKVDLALFALRLVCCSIVAFALTVIFAEFLSRRAMVAIIALAYGCLGLVYSWTVPMWRWYMEEARAKGFIAFMPETLQNMLLRTSLLDWITDTTFLDRIRPFLPLLLPLSKAEQNAVLEQLPVETQILMTRPGMVALLPRNMQKLLLPSTDEDVLSNVMVAHTRNKEGSSPASTGFDFHKSSTPIVAVRSKKNSSADNSTNDDIASMIVSKRVINVCNKLLATPTPASLNRTASISVSLLLLQLYLSRRSRHAVLTMIQFTVASSLASVAAFAFLIRAMQLLMTSGQSPLLLRFLRHQLIRSTIITKGTVSLTHAKINESKVQKAATSASVVIALVYLLRRFRK